MTIDCPSIQPLLRGFALDTLSGEEHAHVAAHLEACAACRAALDGERTTLAVLDMLPEQPPRHGLADRTLARVQESAMHRQRPRRWGISLGELAAVSCIVVLCAAIFLPALARSRESARRSSCQNNLKQFGLVCKMYSNDIKDANFPPLLSIEGAGVPDLRTLYPEYLSDPVILLCPTNPAFDRDALMKAFQQTPPDWDTAHRLISKHYCYLGWAVHSKEDIELLLSARDKKPAEDLKTDGHTLYWLREGVEQRFVTDPQDPAETARIQSGIPVAFDNPAAHAHVPNGVNVLYLDGHVQFVKLPPDASLRQALEIILDAK